MVGRRSARARARARHLLATVYPMPEDAELHRLRELANDYVRQADRIAAANQSTPAESDELVSATLDAVARDFFAHAFMHCLGRPTTPKKPK